jgi:hypothetical protein
MQQLRVEETGKTQVQKESQVPQRCLHAGDPVLDLALPMLHGDVAYL